MAPHLSGNINQVNYEQGKEGRETRNFPEYLHSAECDLCMRCKLLCGIYTSKEKQILNVNV